MTPEFTALDLACVNTMRTLSIDMVQKANSGHPGLPLGASPMAYVLWQRHLKHDPAEPSWADRDRFVLSAGHGSALLYALLHLSGYGVGLDELRSFRQWGSRTAGHPEFRQIPGIEATTGPLGQGAANSVGMAIAERRLANLYNRDGHIVVDHRTWALVSDGDIMEGVCAESASLAGHLRLGKLIWLYDANDVTLDGPASLSLSENVQQRFSACGWQVLTVADGDQNLAAIDQAIVEAKRDSSRPSLVIVKTTIGYGSPNKHGLAASHGSPLGVDEAALTKQALGCDPKAQFEVSDEVRAHFAESAKRGKAEHRRWAEAVAAYCKAFPDLASEWRTGLAGELPANWDANLPEWAPGQDEATRQSSGKVLNAIAATVPWLIGGDADLSSSTQTSIKCGGSFDGQTGAGRNIHFGIREHAMAAIANGIAYHGGLRTFVSTFFCFCDYMRPSIRVAALAQLPVIYVFTHDSIAVGEDGPTHQPVEQLASLRAIPGLLVWRPADANETVQAWQAAMNHAGPVALVLTRQKVPTIDRVEFAPANQAQRGAYVLTRGGAQPDVIVMATGSEVSLALQARKVLEKKGLCARVVSMPCWETYAAQDRAYRDSVLPPDVRARVSIEAGVTMGWSRWVGDRGVCVGVDRFGASAPSEIVLDKLGMTVSHVVSAAMQAIENR